MVFIIAEIGVNWDGDFDLLRNMVEKAKRAGCNAVKFQAFQKDLVEKHPESSRLMQSAISEENIEKVNEICKNLGIDGVDLYGGTRHITVIALRKFATPEQIKRATMHSTNKAFERYFRIESDEVRDVYRLTQGGPRKKRGESR